jgi:hypothetical protein
MSSLEAAKDDLGFCDHTAKMHYNETLPPQPFLRCPDLKKLDLQWLRNEHDRVMRRPGTSRSSR